MNIRDFEYLRAVATLASFSRAAESCHVSQPSLSAQVKKMESRLGGPLFVRGRKAIKLTPLGEQLMPHIHTLLDAHETLMGMTPAKSPDLLRLTIGAIPTVAPYLFPPLAQRLSNGAAANALTLVEEKTDVLLTGLINGQFDAAIIALPTDPHIFNAVPLFDDVFTIALPADHVLAQQPGAIDMADLQSERMLLLGEGHCLRQQALTICDSRQVRESRMFQATSLETLRHLVAIGEGVTLMPTIAIRPDPAIVYKPIRGHGYSREIGIVWPRSRPQPQHLPKLAALIGEIYAKRPF